MGGAIEDTSRCRLQASPQGVKSFLDDAYGLSVHWGVYSLNVGENDEWLYWTERIPFEVYRRRFFDRFNPTRFCADEWADLMLESGQKFLIITCKHHDGFCLWDTALTDWKITNTPFGRDAISELAQALRDRGLKLHCYYSLVDWTHPAYHTDWPAYVAYHQGQLRELCTNFGEIGGIVLDGYWPRFPFKGEEAEFFPGKGEWDLAGTYELIHTLQPHAVVVNNTHVPPLPGEDYQVWELDMPGENTTGFNTTEIGDRPKAVWWNLNAGWAYAPRNQSVKSADTILDTMRRVREAKAVFFLNVGPRSFGDIHPEEQRVLREIGRRLRSGHISGSGALGVLARDGS